jgi:hypothetical protein
VMTAATSHDVNLTFCLVKWLLQKLSRTFPSVS